MSAADNNSTDDPADTKETPSDGEDNVFLLADFGHRLLGRLLDTALVVAIGGVVLVVVIAGMGPWTNIDDPDSYFRTTSIATAAACVVASLVGAFLTYRQGKTGQTPGMKVARVRLVREYDAKPDMRAAFLRWTLELVLWLFSIATLVLLVLPFVVYLWPLWDGKKRQTLIDKVAHTVVVEV